MKIICTDDEKEMLILTLASSKNCPFEFTGDVPCDELPHLDRCMKCIRESIEWDTPEERERKKKEHNRKYRETHKEHNRKYLNEWRKNNPEKYKAQKARERQRMKDRRREQ